MTYEEPPPSDGARKRAFDRIITVGGWAIVIGIAVFASLLIGSATFAFVQGFITIPNPGQAFAPVVKRIIDFMLTGLGLGITILLVGGAVIAIVMLVPRRKDLPPESAAPSATSGWRIASGDDGRKLKALKPPDRVVDANPTHAE